MKLNAEGMRRHLVFAITALLFANSCGSERPEATPRARADALARQVVTAAYQRLETYSGGASDGLAFRLGDFRTLDRPAFGSIKMSELATPEVGDVIDLSILRYPEHGTPVAYYRPSWASGALVLAPQDQRRMETLTVVDLIEREGAREVLLKKVQAVTLFSVEVRLAGRSRSYRAAFLWHELSAERENAASAIPLDQITLGLDEVVNERSGPPKPGSVPGQPAVTSRAAALSSSADGGPPMCEPFSSSKLFTLVTPADGYTINFGAEVTCSCDSNCTSTCDPKITSTVCRKDGGCRAAPSVNFDYKPSIAGDAHKDAPASCAAAIGCTGRKCGRFLGFICGCNLKIVIKPTIKALPKIGELAAEITWDPNGDPKQGVLAAKFEPTARCPRCYEAGKVGSQAVEGAAAVAIESLGPDIEVTQPGCGNDVCEPDENCHTCSQDCGGCGGGGAGGAGGEAGGGGGGSSSCSKSPPTEVPTTSGPNGCFNDINPTFSWSPVAAATDYAVKVFEVTSQPDADVLLYFNSTANTTLQLPFTLSPEKRYRWAVKGMNCGGTGQYSEMQYFTISSDCRAPQVPPVLVGPQGCVDATRPTFAWSAVPRATAYRIVVSPADRDRFFIDQFVTGTSLPSPVALEPRTQFRFKVRAINDAGAGPWAESMNLTPFCGGVASMITAPQGCIDTATPVFSWLPVPPAVEYWLLVGNSPNFGDPSTIRYVDEHLTGTRLAPGVPFASGQTYYVKVKSILDPSSTTAAAWSPTISFTPFCPTPASSQPARPPT